GFTWGVTTQVVHLLDELPQYGDNLRNKVRSLRGMAPGSRGLEKLVKDISADEPQTPPADTKAHNEEDAEPPSIATDALKPIPRSVVVVQPESPPWLSRLPVAFGTIAESLGGIALATVLVVFMLLKREDLRNRLLRLIGHGRVTLTTKAVDDAAH